MINVTSIMTYNFSSSIANSLSDINSISLIKNNAFNLIFGNLILLHQPWNKSICKKFNWDSIHKNNINGYCDRSDGYILIRHII